MQSCIQKRLRLILWHQINSGDSDEEVHVPFCSFFTTLWPRGKHMSYIFSNKQSLTSCKLSLLKCVCSRKNEGPDHTKRTCKLIRVFVTYAINAFFAGHCPCTLTRRTLGKLFSRRHIKHFIIYILSIHQYIYIDITWVRYIHKRDSKKAI